MLSAAATSTAMLPTQARVKEQETQKRLFNIKRVVCIGGGVALVLLAWTLLIASSRDRIDAGAPPAARLVLTKLEAICRTECDSCSA